MINEYDVIQIHFNVINGSLFKNFWNINTVPAA